MSNILPAFDSIMTTIIIGSTIKVSGHSIKCLLNVQYAGKLIHELNFNWISLESGHHCAVTNGLTLLMTHDSQIKHKIQFFPEIQRENVNEFNNVNIAIHWISHFGFPISTYGNNMTSNCPEFGLNGKMHI